MFIMKRKFLMDALSSRESQSLSCIKEKKQGKIYLALISGFFATTGSILGKLSSNIEMNSIVSNITSFFTIFLYKKYIYKICNIFLYFFIYIYKL